MSSPHKQRVTFKPPRRIDEESEERPGPKARSASTTNWQTDLFVADSTDEVPSHPMDAILRQTGPTSRGIRGSAIQKPDEIHKAQVEALLQKAIAPQLASMTVKQSDSEKEIFADTVLRGSTSSAPLTNRHSSMSSIERPSSPHRNKTSSFAESIRDVEGDVDFALGFRKPSKKDSKKEKKKRDKKEGKKEGKVAWSAEVFVAPSEDREATSHPKLKRHSSATRMSMRIENREKLLQRFHWAQELMSRNFLPYKQVLCEGDDLLPSPDEIAGMGEQHDEKLDAIRDAMLDDGELDEREIAAFFEGLALFGIKVKSLESQLDSLKAEKRNMEDARRLMSFHSGAGGSARSVSAMLSRSPYQKSTLQEPIDERRRRTLDHAQEPYDERHKLIKAPSETQILRGHHKSLRAMSIAKVQIEQKDNKEVQRLLKELEDFEKKQQKLEKQLQQAGIVIAEDIPYDEAKGHVERIAKRMNEIGSANLEMENKDQQAKLQKEYFQLEQEMERYNAALMLTDEWNEEQEKLEQKWEDDNAAENVEALKKLRRHMPVNVKSLSEAQLCSDETPNGKQLPKAMARKFKRTNVLQLLRTDPEDLVRLHPSTLENLRVTGLTLTERRAIHAHLITVGPRWKSMQADAMTERKWTWHKMMKQNFQESLESYQRHAEQYGPPENHLNCPLIGKQCPLNADKQVDYDGDYGFTEDAVYEETSVKKSDTEDPGAKAMREAAELSRTKKASERNEVLKKHYKGKVLQVSLANGSCESMDESMDRMEFLRHKWIGDRLKSDGKVTDEGQRQELAAFSDALNEFKLALLGYAERSGMQLTGKKDSNADRPDIRSSIELGLSEDLFETAIDFFEDMEDRMDEMKARDSRLKSTVGQLRELLDELHERNVNTLKDLGVKRPERSRRRKSRAEIIREVKQLMRDQEHVESEESREAPAVPVGGGGRGDVLGALAGRGRGGDPGRGDLMSAIAGRGRGGEAGRGDLMSAIAARGRGAGASGGRDDGGGLGNLMAAIEARGRGRGPPGGRGDLMAALAARGRGAD